MADKKISELNLHTVPTLSDSFATVNGGETKKVLLGALNETIRNSNTPLTASGITVGDGSIVPTTPQGATLGTVDKPFKELFLQSGSITVESDIPGDPSAVISNINGNLEISVGGMRLVRVVQENTVSRLMLVLEWGWVGLSFQKSCSLLQFLVPYIMQECFLFPG